MLNVERSEDVQKIYTARKTETKARTMNVSNGGQRAFKDQRKIRNNAPEAISRSTYHAKRETQVSPKRSNSLLFLYSDCANSKAMISHVITVISKTVVHLSLGQIIVNATLCVRKTNFVDSEGYCRGI